MGECGLGAVLEPPALVARLHDVTVLGEPAEQHCCHFRVPKTFGHSPKVRLVVAMTEARS